MGIREWLIAWAYHQLRVELHDADHQNQGRISMQQLIDRDLYPWVIALIAAAWLALSLALACLLSTMAPLQFGVMLAISMVLVLYAYLMTVPSRPPCDLDCPYCGGD